MHGRYCRIIDAYIFSFRNYGNSSTFLLCLPEVTSSNFSPRAQFFSGILEEGGEVDVTSLGSTQGPIEQRQSDMGDV